MKQLRDGKYRVHCWIRSLLGTEEGVWPLEVKDGKARVILSETPLKYLDVELAQIFPLTPQPQPSGAEFSIAEPLDRGELKRGQ